MAARMPGAAGAGAAPQPQSPPGQQLTKEQQLELALRQFVRGALQGILAPQQNTRNFHTMLSQIEKLDDKDPARARWFRALADCTSLIAAAPPNGIISHLLDPIWEFPVDQAPADTVKAFCGLTQNLVTTNLRFAEPCLRMWVSHITRTCAAVVPPTPSDGAADSDADADAASAAADADRIQDLAHSMLQQLVRLTPQTTTLLLRVLVFEFPPHASSPAPTLLMYTKNLLRVSEYCPSLRDSILTTIVERLLRMDLEITKLPQIQQQLGLAADPDGKTGGPSAAVKGGFGGEDDQGGIFQLEEEGEESGAAPPPQAQAEAQLQLQLQSPELQREVELAGKLDSLLSLMFEYLRLVKDCDPEMCDSVFASLLRTFGRSLLKVHGSHFIQYLLFVSCGFEHRYSASFARSLLNVVLDGAAEPGLRSAAAAYLGSFLGHARALRVGLVTECFDRMLTWTHAARPHILGQLATRQAAEESRGIHANAQRNLAALNSAPVSPVAAAGNNRRSPDRRPFPNAVFGGHHQPRSPQNQNGGIRGGVFAGVQEQHLQPQQPEESHPANANGGDLYNERVFQAVVQAIVQVLCQRLPELLAHYSADAGDALAPQFARIGRGRDRNDSLGQDDSDGEDALRFAQAPIWTGSPALGALQGPHDLGGPPSLSLGGETLGTPDCGSQGGSLPHSAGGHMGSAQSSGQPQQQQTYLRTQVEEFVLRQCRLQTLLRDDQLRLLERCCERVKGQLLRTLHHLGVAQAVLPAGYHLQGGAGGSPRAGAHGRHHSQQRQHKSLSIGGGSEASEAALGCNSCARDQQQSSRSEAPAGACWSPFEPFRLRGSRRFIDPLYSPALDVAGAVRVVDLQRHSQPQPHHHHHYVHQPHVFQPRVAGAMPIMPRPGAPASAGGRTSVPPPRPLNRQMMGGPADEGSDADDDSDEGSDDNANAAGGMNMAFSLYD